MKLKQIEFVFENCDRIVIDGKYIGDFLVEDIKTSVRRVATNSIERMDIAYVFAIEIIKAANIDRYQFEQNQIESYKQKTFDRFMDNDITSIHFTLYEENRNYDEEGKEGEISKINNICKEEQHDYYLHWTEDEKEVKNTSQQTYISKCDNLYIIVAENKSIDDFFDKEEIESKDAMSFKKNIYDIE